MLLEGKKKKTITIKICFQYLAAACIYINDAWPDRARFRSIKNDVVLNLFF
jgi:hypothetical protein